MTERDRTLDDGDVTDEYPVVWREERDGLKAEVLAEEYVDEHFDPRDNDGNLGVMVCWHPEYALGDQQFTDGNGRGAVDKRVERDGFRSMRHLARYLGIVKRAVCIIPLYLYDHSGISISAGEPNPFDNPRVRTDEFGRGLGWDTSMVGFIYTTEERIAELQGDGAEYREPARVAQSLRNEVDEYDRYLRGEVYLWRVVDDEDENLESCGGYLPDVSVRHDAELDYVKQEAREALAWLVEERAKRAEQARQGWAFAHGRGTVTA